MLAESCLKNSRRPEQQRIRIKSNRISISSRWYIRKSAKIKTVKVVWNQQKIKVALKPAKNKTGKIVLKSQQITAVTSSEVSNPPINFLSNLINGILRHARLEKHIMHWPSPPKDFLGSSASFSDFCSHIPISTFYGVWEVWLVQPVPAHKSLTLWKLSTWLTYPSLLFWQPCPSFTSSSIHSFVFDDPLKFIGIAKSENISVVQKN